MRELTAKEIIKEMDSHFTCKTKASEALGIKLHVLRALSARVKGVDSYPKIANRKNLIALAKALNFKVVDPEKIYIED